MMRNGTSIFERKSALDRSEARCGAAGGPGRNNRRQALLQRFRGSAGSQRRSLRNRHI